MKNIFYILIFCFSTSSCYSYKAKSEANVEDGNKTISSKQSSENTPEKTSLKNIGISNSTPNSNLKKDQSITSLKNYSMRIEDQLEINKYFKIDAGGSSYKIKVERWESDTLVAHIIHKPKKILKFHKNQIDQTSIKERRFSQRTADIITVISYAAVGFGIFALVR